ncbi:MAG: hypothetical protein JWL70_1499 [Acidimicrobiia bacterium]|nr:hypothetical protein [Acidimicrobiia bacterium]
MAVLRESVPIVGRARVGRRTKELINRLQPGDVAVIDHVDLDRVAADALVEAGVVAVLNASPSSTGRYPNLGPVVLAEAGVVLIDGLGPQLLDIIADSAEITVLDAQVWCDGRLLAQGHRPSLSSSVAAFEEARRSMGAALEDFATNTLDRLRSETHLAIGPVEIPDLGIDFRGRHALVVVRGVDYRDDLIALKRGGYMRDMRPVLIGVDGGADALVEAGYRPHLIVGDFDSVSEATLRCGARLVVHAYGDGRAPGAARLDLLGLPYVTMPVNGTSEDIALLMAFEGGAELIVAVGTHNSMEEFLDTGRAGMASTFLVRLKVGRILIDAKGVSRLYQPRVSTRDVVMLILTFVVLLITLLLLNDPLRLWLRSLRLLVFDR